MIERTLVLLKPDAVQRGHIGEIISRFERIGLKVVGLKMAWADRDFAKRHYTEELAARRGQAVRDRMLDYLSLGPVVALCLEGVSAIETVRKLVGPTEPKAAPPGTIRGDFAHVAFDYADSHDLPVFNLIHASADAKDAQAEVELWFAKGELHTYRAPRDEHLLAPE